MYPLYCLYQLIIGILFILPLTLLTALLTLLGSFFGKAHFWGYYPGKLWSIAICRLLLLPVRVTGREHLQPHQSYVFVANHQGSMDIFLIYGFLGRNFKWMMKKSLRHLPLIGIACAKAKHIFVDKSGPKKIQETYTQARDTLQHGTSLVVFPEGARTFTGHMGIFRKGAFQLAQEIGLPIVPLTINGSFDILPRMRGFSFVRRHRLTLQIHPPILPQETADASHLRSTMQTAYDEIMAGLPPAYQGYVRNEDQ